jgi:hypothetical protein
VKRIGRGAGILTLTLKWIACARIAPNPVHIDLGNHMGMH